MSVAGEVEDATHIDALNDTIPRDDAPTEAITDTQDTVHTYLDTPKDAQDAVTVADVTKDTTEVLVDDEAPDAPPEELDTKDSADTLVDAAVSFFTTFCWVRWRR